MRLLIISHLYPNNKNLQFGRFVKKQVDALSSLGHEIFLTIPIPYTNYILTKLSVRWGRFYKLEASIDEKYQYQYIRYLRLPGALYRSIEPLICFVCSFLSYLIIIKKFKPDIIYSNMITVDGFVACILGKMFSIPTVGIAIGDDINEHIKQNYLLRATMSFTLRNLDLVYFVSKSLEANLPTELRNRVNSRVLYRGTSIPQSVEYKPSIIKKFLFVGTLQHGKGIKEIIGALSFLKEEKFEFHIVGDGELYSELLQISTQDPRLKLHGYVSYDNIARMFLMADIFVFPSHHEGMPNALVEAAAFALPIIASDIEPHTEFFEGENLGWLFEVKNSKELARSIRCVLGLSDDELLRFSNHSRLRAERDFNFDDNVKSILPDLEKLIDYR